MRFVLSIMKSCMIENIGMKSDGDYRTAKNMVLRRLIVRHRIHTIKQFVHRDELASCTLEVYRIRSLLSRLWRLARRCRTPWRAGLATELLVQRTFQLSALELHFALINKECVSIHGCDISSTTAKKHRGERKHYL